ncbi:MAG TPA: NADH-quinone oxidoreductase subunit D, partial [Desulfobulbus sp.]|nr:NADH-quinone oxidoreductase subunit D [Desulfobulbus sp.]
TPRGELMIYLVSDGTKVPYRVKFRVPSFANLSIFSHLARGQLLADVLAILGSLDMVIPEVDR